ncbi:MAG: PP-loop domain protein [Desulfonauticus sp. 38_4375]|nr:MAG: PP-loop domain protein [Desulfonauticus sp. 38_4375]
MKCTRCKQKAVVALPSHNAGFCPSCYLEYFKRQVEKAIKAQNMFSFEDKILVAISGGKDSLALTLQLKELGYNVSGLHIDLNIPESSAEVRKTVEDFCTLQSIPLYVLEMKKEGLSIPEVKKRLSRPICSACGQIKRYHFNLFAKEKGFTVLATGHNLDDEVARLFANTLRWDIDYLSDQGPVLKEEQGFVKKVKPLYRLTEFETANYAFLKGINYSYKPCPFSKGASFTFYKKLIASLEQEQPGRKLNFYETFLKQGQKPFKLAASRKNSPLNACSRCGYPTSGEICGVCRIKELLAC